MANDIPADVPVYSRPGLPRAAFGPIRSRDKAGQAMARDRENFLLRVETLR